jgi:hypothetical protein
MKECSRTRRRPRLQWTLGTLMASVALLSLLFAWARPIAAPTPEEVAYMSLRGLWGDFQRIWTPVQRSLYLEQIRGHHHGLPFSQRAKALGVEPAVLRREADGLWGVLLWDRSKPDPVPIHRD